MKFPYLVLVAISFLATFGQCGIRDKLSEIKQHIKDFFGKGSPPPAIANPVAGPAQPFEGACMPGLARCLDLHSDVSVDCSGPCGGGKVSRRKRDLSGYYGCKYEPGKGANCRNVVVEL